MPGKKLSSSDLRHFEAQLKMLLGALEGDIHTLQAGALGDGQRSETQGDEGEGYAAEFSLELLQFDEKTAGEVREALARVADGSYGRCELCERWLLKERLRAMPHARRCVACQKATETEAG